MLPHYEGWRAFGNICMKRGKHKLALSVFENAPAFGYELGTVALKAREYKTAIKMNRELEAKPWSIDAWNGLLEELGVRWGIESARRLYEMARLEHEGTRYFSTNPRRGGADDLRKSAA